MDRHFAIIGMSFCGSTVLSYVLGALPGLATIGESHWINSEPLPGADPAMCGHCGMECEVLNADFLRQMRSSLQNWYPRLADRLGTRRLVSADKNLDLIIKYDPLLKLDPIFCFRSPLGSFQSYRRSANLGPDDGGLLDLPEYLSYWSWFYENALQVPVQGERFFVNWDAFSAAPETELQWICEWLGVECDLSALFYWRKAQHAVGGNFSPWERMKISGEQVLHIQRMEPVAADASDIASFESHPAFVTYHKLMESARVNPRSNPPA
jgi:hypothetical protein